MQTTVNCCSSCCPRKSRRGCSAARSRISTRLLRDKLAAAEIPAASDARLCHAAPSHGHCRGHPARHSRTAPRSGAGLASERRSRRSRASCASAGHRLDRGMRDPRHRQGRILFRGDQPAGPAGRRGVAGAGEGGDLRAALAEIDALPGFVAALGSAADLGRSACSTARSCRCRSTGSPVGRVTRGHRFLSPGEICVADAAEYLAPAWRCACRARSGSPQGNDRGRISNGRLRPRGLSSSPIPGCSTRSPVSSSFRLCSAGAIDAEFMTLPPEVLATAMRTHQKYFSCLRADGTPAPRFLFVANNLAADRGKTIIAGNERVLRARLADARFFWDQDRRVPLEARVDALSQRVFHAKLGSLQDKVRRMERSPSFSRSTSRGRHRPLAARRAARQGRFVERHGRRVPRTAGRSWAAITRCMTANIRRSRTRSPSITGRLDRMTPARRRPDSVVAALADKIDSLVAFFAIGEKPTGSRDPFALRRAALGIIRLVLENDLRLPLATAIRRALIRAFGREYSGPSPASFSTSSRTGCGCICASKGSARSDCRRLRPLGQREDDLVRLMARVDGASRAFSLPRMGRIC